MTEHRWWLVDDLLRSAERFAPARIGHLPADLIERVRRVRRSRPVPERRFKLMTETRAPSTGAEPLPEHVQKNRAHWDDLARTYLASGEHHWAAGDPTWGIWNVSESDVRMFPDDLDGKDVIELGCGTAYVSAWVARRGARVVGIDNSERQLETARRLQKEHGLEFPLIHGNAERVPYPDATFDFAISEYGACLWADPEPSIQRP